MIAIAPLGMPWIHTPANDAANLPAADLSFADLRTLTGQGAVPTNTLQQAYFGWLAWPLIVVTLLAAAAMIAIRTSWSAIALAAVSVAALVVTTFAVKGPLTWSAFLDQAPNMRIGGVLVLVGWLLTLAAGASGSRGRA
ncbi:hypothetical protein CS378_16625 [Rhodococcus ruber]|nr:hypothetical protein CS378_16625 [Rhodococcus ruber]